MKINSFLTLILLMASSTSFGKAALISLPEKVEASDLIARVEILSIHQIENPTDYLWEARAKVITGVKGVTKSEIIDLQFHNGNICPNVWYSPSDDCIIFAVKMDNNHYHTYNTYFGKILVNQLPMPSGEIISFVHGHALGLGLDSYLVFDEAVLEIKKHINTDAEPVN